MIEVITKQVTNISLSSETPGFSRLDDQRAGQRPRFPSYSSSLKCDRRPAPALRASGCLLWPGRRCPSLPSDRSGAPPACNRCATDAAAAKCWLSSAVSPRRSRAATNHLRHWPSPVRSRTECPGRMRSASAAWRRSHWRDQAPARFSAVLALPVAHQLVNLFVAHEAALQALRRSDFRRDVQHVAASQQSLCAGRVENDARVDRRGHREGDARREVGLDQAGDHIHAGPLRGDDQMNAGGARHLRQTADRLFRFVGSQHHQVGQLVDDDHDVRQDRFLRSRLLWRCSSSIFVL